MKTKLLKAAIVAAVVLFTATTNLQAQVVVGDAIAPQPFSVMEIISNGTQGLRLPQLNNTQKAAVETAIKLLDTAGQLRAEGLMIFNIEENCVEVWNGTVWISMCAD